jgi:hypothetical protein
MAATVSIRVPETTRDTLKTLAAQRGTSISQTIDQLAEAAYWAEFFRSEREAQRLDDSNPAVAAEDADWEATLTDGLG